MSYQQGFLTEFIESKYCHDEISTKAIIEILDANYLVNNVILNYNFVFDKLILLQDSEVGAYVKNHVDALLNGIYERHSVEGESALSYISNIISNNTPDGETNPLATHVNRREGDLYESILASVLYTTPSDTVALKDDDLILKRLIVALIDGLITYIRDWLASSNEPGEIYKPFSKYLISQPSTNSGYLLSVVELVGINKFFEKVKLTTGLDGAGIIDIFEINEDDLISLSMKYSEDVLIAIRSVTNKQYGIFLSLTKEVLSESVYTESNLSKEIQAARIFKRKQADDRVFWVEVGGCALRVMADSFNDFMASNIAPAPSIP